ncbi:hypothetical protein [Dyella nitratireducens]|uniref:HAMP domain-containing protein n=1 Tax=Dyella nitratireducens TaxID=1849580 RepID=A0ABQ1GAT1_9GAMM|nr:hypothetical protein [Dyella nitratireducens]GGA40139.1 hypothetical protein GCM10010981_31750 [Dyella nitratireducens]GLQ40533.1 hypothetical protein GCM10007902_03820 [Dyella nitratireducens]
MKPSLGFLLRGMLAVVVLTLAAALSAKAFLKQAANSSELERLQQTGLIEQELQKSEFEQLALRAQMLASDRDFVEYVTQSLTPNPARGGAIDKLSITDLLGERRQGYDVAMVLDAQGQLVSQSGVLAERSDSIASDPLVTQTIKGGAPSQGAWFQDGVLYWVVVSPLTQANALKGLLVTANQANHLFSQRVAGLSRSDVVLMTSPSTVAAFSGGVDVPSQNVLSAHGADVMALARSGGGALVVRDGQRDVQTWVTPVRVSGLDLAMVALDMADDHAFAQSELLLVGSIVLFGVIVALLVVTQWWRTWRPLDQILDVLDRAAQGDHTLVLRVRGSALVTRIGESFNRILNPNRS